MVRKVLLFFCVFIIGSCSNNKGKELYTLPPDFIKPFTKLIFVENIKDISYGRQIKDLERELNRQYKLYELTIASSRYNYINYIARVDKVADGSYKWSIFDSGRSKVLSIYTFSIRDKVSDGEYLRLMIEALKNTYSNYEVKKTEKEIKKVICVDLQGDMILSDTWSRLLIASLKASLSSQLSSSNIVVGDSNCLVNLFLKYSEEKVDDNYRLKFNWQLSSEGKQVVDFDQGNVLSRKDYDMLPHNFFLLTDYIAKIIGNYI